MRKLRLKKVKYLDQWHIVGSGRARLGPTLQTLNRCLVWRGLQEQREKKKKLKKKRFWKSSISKEFFVIIISLTWIK